MDVSFPLSSLWSLSLPQKLFGRSHHPRVVTIANHHWREDTSPELLPPPHHWTAIVKAKRINAEGTYDSNTSLSHRFLPRKAPHIDSFTLFLTKELTHDNCSLSSSSLVKITHDSLSLSSHPRECVLTCFLHRCRHWSFLSSFVVSDDPPSSRSHQPLSEPLHHRWSFPPPSSIVRPPQAIRRVDRNWIPSWLPSRFNGLFLSHCYVHH